MILLTYAKPFSEVEKHLAAHRAYSDRHYAAGAFLCSGPRNPRTGFVIVCRADGRAEGEALTMEDPFRVYGVADYEIIEFLPDKYLPGFEQYL